jgi:hypothetical protein
VRAYHATDGSERSDCSSAVAARSRRKTSDEPAGGEGASLGVGWGVGFGGGVRVGVGGEAWGGGLGLGWG